MEELLLTMMSFRPVSSDVPAVNALTLFLRDHLAEQRLHTRVVSLGNRKILYAATRPGRSPVILLNAHLDVVPGDEKLFTPQKRRGWIYGRGARDCLGNCVVLAHVLAACRHSADIGVVFSTDEEIGGATTAHMITQRYRGNAVLVMDGSGNQIATAQKGVLTVTLKAKGKACHAATPWKGENALDRLIDGYVLIRRLFKPVTEGDEWHTTMSATVAQAGTVFNRIPDSAEMTLNLRYTEKTSPKQLIARIRSASGLQVRRLQADPVVFCDEKSKLVQELAAAMRSTFGRPIPMVRMNAATDARHLAALRVPIAIIGVPGRGAHAATEGVSLAGMHAYEKLLVKFCRMYAPR